MVEKRKHNRFKIYQMIQISIGREHYVACEGINISKSGMLVRTSTEVDGSARFYLLFEVPLESGNYEIRCEGLAAHVHKVGEYWEVGISFLDLFEDDEKILEKYLESLKEIEK
jgi:hypothetical protein